MIIKAFGNSVEGTAGYIEVLFQNHKIRRPKLELLYWAFKNAVLLSNPYEK